MTHPWLCPFGRLQQVGVENNGVDSLVRVVCVWMCTFLCGEIWKLKLQRQMTRATNGCVLYPERLVFAFFLC